ncbi:uncharacterized protein [Battus philenor]|uniref:uncharacterized protein n=1 Tax=Battus philenor TaxID=42288 RepID=UPI0035D0ED35
MLRRGSKYLKKCTFLLQTQNRSFLTNEYKCEAAWSEQKSSPVLRNVNLNDFYTTLSQNFTSKGVISAIDVDVFANAVRDPAYLEELKDLLFKLRLSAETGNTLESTYHATVRNYIEFGNIQDLIHILKNPLNYGIFLDDITANILLDKLVTSNNYELAANVAGLIMLQEEFSNEITCALSQYACYKYLTALSGVPLEETPKQEEKKKIEEIKIRVKFIRNFYYDDHFDIKDLPTLSGKTLAWISKRNKENVNDNLQIIGWLHYKKYDKLLTLCEDLNKSKSFKVYEEVLKLIEKHMESCEKETLEKCSSLLKLCPKTELVLEDSIKNLIEDAINKIQKRDISTYQMLFQTWEKKREEKLKEQLQRLKRVQRIAEIEEKQKELKVEEQKLWFFENEDKIDLEIENKQKLENEVKTSSKDKSDENYIPPEILPKRK